MSRSRATHADARLIRPEIYGAFDEGRTKSCRDGHAPRQEIASYFFSNAAAIVSSTLSETSGTYLVTPNWLRTTVRPAVEADRRRLAHRIGAGAVEMRVHSRRLGDAMQRQIAFDHREAVRAPASPWSRRRSRSGNARRRASRRKLSSPSSLALVVWIEAIGIVTDKLRRGQLGGIERQRARRLRQETAEDREAHMIDREDDLRVAGLDRIGARRHLAGIGRAGESAWAPARPRWWREGRRRGRAGDASGGSMIVCPRP